jgi:hypothetical protein
MMVIAFYIASVEATLNLPLSSVHLRERRAVQGRAGSRHRTRLARTARVRQKTEAAN